MPTVRVTPSATTLRLSDTVELTMTVEGRLPLRVELPSDLLDPASAQIWQIEPVGGGTFSPDGDTWAKQFRLSPFVPGEAIPLRWNPIRVNGVELTPEVLTFQVETSLRQPTADDARPVTGIEPLPTSPPSGSPLILVGVSLLTLLAAALVVVLVLSRKRKPVPLTPAEWFRRELSALRSRSVAGPAFVERFSSLFREFLTRRFGLNTERTTTAELIAAGESLWDTDSRSEVGRLLGICDAVKFAGRIPSVAECDALAQWTTQLVQGWE